MAIALPLAAAQAAGAAEPAPGETPLKPVCLDLADIDHTEIADDVTILFTMKDSAVWENLLPERCPGLKDANGFEYTGYEPRLCANVDLIRPAGQDTACALGSFLLYQPADEQR